MSDNLSVSSDQDLVTAPPVTRDERGRLLPGAKLNPVGRPNGRPNNTTLLASARLQSAADTAAAFLVERMNDKSEHPQARIWAATRILAMTMPEKLREIGTSEMEGRALATFMTDSELATTGDILDRAKERLDRARKAQGVEWPTSTFGQVAAPIEPIDVSFTLDTLPAPVSTEPNPDDEYEVIE